jgi:hypothetical protein
LLHEFAGLFAGEGGAGFDDLLQMGLDGHWVKGSR